MRSTIHRQRRLPALVLGAVLAASMSGVAQHRDSTTISAAQHLPVSRLDSTASDIPLARWLARLGGVAESSIRWELNDCGEGGDGRSAPSCVEARLELAPDTSVCVSLIVADLEGKAATPKVWSLYAFEGKKAIVFRSFTSLAAYIRSRHPEAVRR